MTADIGADDPRFGDLLDDLLTQLLEGQEPDLPATAARHPAMAHRIPEALALVGGTAGRRQQPRPSLQGYEIVHEIGRGGMGTVYLARQTSLDREVALKVLPQSFGLSPKSRQRFLLEARALARVEHDHIIGIHRILDDGDVLAFEMEYVDGPSLQDVLDHLRAARQEHRGPPTLAQVKSLLGPGASDLGARNLTQFFVRIALKIGRALGAVHAAGLVHRDVKPANVLLRRSGEPVLVDFGLARVTGLEASRTGGFSGTPVYSAPEQLRGDPTIGPAADVYGLAVTLYECLTLSRPFAGRSTTDQLRAIENGRFVPLRHRAPDVPRDLVTILAHAMEVDPERRYRDGAAFADDLQRLLDLQPVLARPAGPIRRVGKLLRRQRNSLLAGCLGAVLVTAAMIPILDHVDAAGRRLDLARHHMHAAQQHLISVDGRHLARPRSLRSQANVNAPLAAALAEYERALELEPTNAEARRERDVVRLALWLRRLVVPDERTLHDRLYGTEFRAMTADLGELTVHAARALASGTFGPGAPDADLDAATPADRATLGLLRFLFGDFGMCEDSWQGLPPAMRDQPLVCAGLGVIHCQDEMPDQAHVQLLKAQRHFPESAQLRLALADSALALGDLQQAHQWLADLPATADTAPLRRRLDLDLDAGRLTDEELAAGYRALAESDPSDPTPNHRLALLALRRGDLQQAGRQLDALIAEWPDVGRFRLDRARLALQQRDLRAYARQALAVLDHDYGRTRSRGTTRDLLEVLRLGGLLTLHREGMAATGGERSGRGFLGGETPIHTFAPAIADAFETLLRAVHDVARQRTRIEAIHPVDGAGGALVTLPLLLARLPILPRPDELPLRQLLGVLPRHMAHGWTLVWPSLRERLTTWGWLGNAVAMRPVLPSPDLPALVAFGNALARTPDATGDGIDDLLVGCGSYDPGNAENHVVLVDGRTAESIDTMFAETDENMLGHAIAIVGDLDGDGRDDWLFGAPSASPRTPFGIAEIWSSATRRRLHHIAGEGPGFGIGVTGLGDVDGDGTEDFAVTTAPMLRNTAAQGDVRIYSGRSQRLLRTLQNDVPGVWFGASIAKSGDIDRDGVADLLVGGNFGTAPGLVRLFSSRTGAVLREWSDPVAANGFGTVVLAIGDADGDGTDDVAISAVRRNDRSGVDQVFLCSGADGRTLAVIAGDKPGTRFGEALTLHRSTLHRPALAIRAPGIGSVTFCSLDGERVATIVVPATDPRFRCAMAVAKDSDGDGREELLLAAPATGGLGRIWRIGSREIPWP